MRIIFMGTPDFAVTTLDALYQAGHEIVLVVTQPDKPKGRKGQPQFSDVKTWAVAHDLPVFQPERIRLPENVEELRKYKADVCVVAAYGQILPQSILEMPKYGCVNVHASLLPKYRGAAPIQWSILNGEKETGVTTMQMGVGLDDGDILEQAVVPIDEEETGGSLFDKLAVVGGKLCVQTLSHLEEGSITPIPQVEEESTHVGMLKKSQGNLDWSRPADELHNYVRGLNPWPSAYSFLGGKMLKIWKSSVDKSTESNALAGTILSADSDGIRVATGDGVLLLTEIQLEGKKRMDAKTFLLGHEIPSGTVLTSER